MEAVGADVAVAGLALADMGGLKGRGERHAIALESGEALLVDESYNANPASMAATLKSLGSEQVSGRRIAVLGAMKELGPHSDELHSGLASAVIEAKIDMLILPGERAGSVDLAADLLLRILRPGDAVLVKASNSVGLARLVERVAGESATCST